MSAKKLNALPYRRLKMMANGIWDEAKKEFYEFKQANATIAARVGYRRFIHSYALSAVNAGDAAVGYSRIDLIKNAVTYYIRVYAPVTVAAANVNNGGHLAGISNVITDSGTAVSVTGSGTTNTAYFTYADIPDDPATGPVIVE